MITWSGTISNKHQSRKQLGNNSMKNCSYMIVLLLVLIIIVVTRNFKVERIKGFTPSIDNVSHVYLDPRAQKAHANVTVILVERNTPSTDVVSLSVYFDPRVQKAHDNATVIFVSVLKAYRQSILGCEVDGIEELKPSVVDIVLSGFIEHYFHVSHMDCFVYCYDMDINEHSKVSLIYSKNGTVLKEPVRTAVVIPKYDVEEDAVMVCAAGYGTIPNLDQWLTYQQTVGIKFIHINIHPSFLVNLNKSSVLQKFVASGYVTMTVWEEYLDKNQVYYYSQSLKYHDCILRYQGRYKYMMVIDLDEYFIPFGDKKDVHSYVMNLIKGNVGSVILSRQEYFCKAKRFNDMAMPSDGNLTKLYETSQSVHDNEGKSIHLVKVIEQNSVHRAGVLFPPYKHLNYRDSPQSSHCQIAHLRTKSKKPCRY